MMVNAAERSVIPGLLGRIRLGVGRIVQLLIAPFLLGLAFFGIVTPVAVLRRTFRGDTFGRRLDTSAETYWVSPKRPTTQPDSLRRQV
jgi:hypothetical protein